MLGTKLVERFLMLLILVNLISSCGGPVCEVVCDIDETQCTIDISCESGSAM